jgi:hypothetical protein
LGNRHTWEGNIKMVYHGIDFEVVGIIYLLKDGVQWYVALSIAINFGVP